MAPRILNLYTTTFLLALFITLVVAASLRLLAILPNTRFTPPVAKRKIGTATRVLIVLGSGGHTSEMLYMLKDLDTRKFTHRTWVVSSGDAFSAGRAAIFEAEMEEEAKKLSKEDLNNVTSNFGPEHYDIATVPRARKIHQPLYTAPFSSLHCLFKCFGVLLGGEQGLPDLIVTNGPATACILVFASLVLKFFDVRGAQSRGKCKTIYAESFARVKTLSLSGKLLLKVVDRFLVQWEELEGAGGRAEYWGILV